ncbi:MAG TPA: hypothetical protein VLB90_04925 [Pseudomonadales bacterium]|nr:hypothetical protein [Pseudomonadales bacterium]
MKQLPYTRCAMSAVLLSVAVLAGCSCSRSSSSSSSDDDESPMVVQAPNYPEQLLQLNEAHEKKLISDEDYQKQLKKINKAMNK